MFSVAAAMLWGYIVRCKRDQITRVLTFLLAAARGTTEMNEKHTPSINYSESKKTCHSSHRHNFANVFQCRADLARNLQ